jgi:transcriptional regulator with XRE-family HTH domain
MKAGEIIGRNIQRHREMAELKQDSLAKLIGITPSALSQIETGKTDISVSRIEQIAKALNKSFFDLLTSPNHIGGIQNDNLVSNTKIFTESLNELLVTMNFLIQKMDKKD